jgi:DNA-binding response OmpR family regulator
MRQSLPLRTLLHQGLGTVRKPPLKLSTKVSPVRDRNSLSGLRILVVEDEFMIADLLTVMLEDLGCVVIGPFADTRSGLEAIEDNVLDGAVLDANLGPGATSAQVAVALQAAALPFVVTTGYASLLLPDEVLDLAPRVTKPFNESQLEAALVAAFGARPS